MLTQSSFDFHKLPPAFLVNVTSGRQDFAFKFSDNITRIRLSIGSEFLYEGKPIKSFDAGKKPSGELKIEFEWDGVDARVEVNDNCALVDTYDFGQRKQ